MATTANGESITSRDGQSNLGIQNEEIVIETKVNSASSFTPLLKLAVTLCSIIVFTTIVGISIFIARIENSSSQKLAQVS